MLYLKEMIEMTKRERDVYKYVVLFRNDKHISPSMRKIAEGIGIKSVSTVSVHVHNIIEKGWFLPYDGTHNSIVPITNRTL